MCTYKFLLDKYFTKPSYLCITEKFDGKIYANAVKVAISSMQSLIQDKKLCDKIFFQLEQVAKLAKLSMYTVFTLSVIIHQFSQKQRWPTSRANSYISATASLSGSSCTD